MLPNFFLSEEENIILCGKIDWLEFVPTDDSVRVLDFKTGKRDEDGESLQLPIYLLLLNELQKRKVSGASYWYLDREDEPKSVELPSLDVAREKVLAVARAVKAAREKGEFACPRVIAGGSPCFACAPYEAILRGEARYLGVEQSGPFSRLEQVGWWRGADFSYFFILCMVYENPHLKNRRTHPLVHIVRIFS